MSSKSTLLRMAAVLAVMVIMAGCTGQSTPPVQPPVVEPTINLQPTLDFVATTAAQTVVAGMTLNAPTATQVVPTGTAAPTETTIPSFTPAPPTVAPTKTVPAVTNTPKPSATVAYNCKIEEQSPAFGDSFPPNAPFDGKWKVTNTSDTTWDSGSVDFKFIGGTKFQDNKDLTVVDLTSSVAHDSSYTVIIDMTAPDKPGTYNATWAFVQGSGMLCPVYINIKVK